jgi:protocatechuate 3,4-dioxygenase beta subunit
MRGLLGAGATVAGGGAAVFAWLDRKFERRSALEYPFPETVGPARRLPPTPGCEDGHHDATEDSVEGPFYTPKTPERAVLREADTVGIPLVIAGRVLSPDCRPIPGAVLDFWHCDAQGVYDNEGFRLRGHQFTDAAGVFRVETVKPGDYQTFGLHRTPHVHVKVQGRETALLTTQLFFPGEPLNRQDWFIKESLTMAVTRSAGGALAARFDFVLA